MHPAFEECCGLNYYNFYTDRSNRIL